MSGSESKHESGPGLGLVVTPAFLPDQLELSSLNPPFTRSIIYRIEDIDHLLRRCEPKPVLITINNECREVGGNWSGWSDVMREIAERYTAQQILGVCVGNEFDIYWANNEQDVPPSFAAELCRTAARWLRPKGIKVVATSVAGPRWIDYLTQLATLVGDDADWFDFHGYGQRPDGWVPTSWGFGNLSTSLQLARDICGKPVIMSEYGVKIADAGSEALVAVFMGLAYQTVVKLGCPLVAWFAWCDQIGAPTEQGTQAFGLRDADGQKRPAWNAFAKINRTSDTLLRWRGIIGDGLLQMMRVDGTQPAQRSSTWLPLGVTPSDVEECYGENGTRYVWLLQTDRGFRFRPS